MKCEEFLIDYLSLCVFLVTGYMPISANNDESNAYMSNIQTVELDEEDVIEAFTFYSAMDQKSYLVKSFKDRLEIYDSQSDELLTTAVLKTYEVDFKRLTNTNKTLDTASLLSDVDAYEKWGNYVFYRKVTVELTNDEALTASLIMTALIYYLGPLGVAASVISIFANWMYANKYKNMYVNIYISTNVYCNILVKKRNDLYGVDSNGNGVFNRSEYQNPSWWGSPYDYTQPAACRILAERY